MGMNGKEVVIEVAVVVELISLFIIYWLGFRLLPRIGYKYSPVLSCAL